VTIAWIAAAAVLVLYTAAGLYLLRMTFVRLPVRHKKPPEEESSPMMAPTERALRTWVEPQRTRFRAIPRETLTVRSFDGTTLYADLETGRDPSVTVICVHGYKSCADWDFAALSDIYRARGWQMLFTDNRAHGRSEGKYIGFGDLDRLDLLVWVREIRRRFPETHVFLHGVSMGAAASMHLAELTDRREVSGIIADCGFDSIGEVIGQCVHVLYHLPAPLFRIPLAPFARLFARVPLWRCRSSRTLARTDIPVFLVYGTEDRYAPQPVAKRIYAACASEKRMLTVPGAGHAASFMMAREAYTEGVLSLVEGAIKRPDASETPQKEAGVEESRRK